MCWWEEGMMTSLPDQNSWDFLDGGTLSRTLYGAHGKHLVLFMRKAV